MSAFCCFKPSVHAEGPNNNRNSRTINRKANDENKLLEQSRAMGQDNGMANMGLGMGLSFEDNANMYGERRNTPKVSQTSDSHQFTILTKYVNIFLTEN